MFDLVTGQKSRSTTVDASRPPRIVLYSHDTLGFGHLRRNLLIAGALKQGQRTPEILMIGGMREAGAFAMPDGVDCVTLPAYAKGTDGIYRPRDLGGDLTALRSLRAQIIMATVESFAPDLMIVDNVPRGAQYELDPVLDMLRARGTTRLVLGLRDVIDSPGVVRRQWLRQRNFETIRKFYDAVWVYGDPSLYDILTDCELGGAIGEIAQHVGYLDPAVRLSQPLAGQDRDAVLGGDARPYVLCAVGGGRDGNAVCAAFAEARLPAGHRGILITGTQMPQALQNRLRKIVARRCDMTLVPFVGEPIALMQGAARIICMGGYNTTCEVLSLGRPTLIVPRAKPRAEQLIRTSRLADRRLVDMLHPDALSAEALSQWMQADTAFVPASTLVMNGLDTVRGPVDGMFAATPAMAPLMAKAS
ncbi:glycosyltransferase family protein [Loktanella sp. DJP18]|uniref:glycosyltransferase family protein n=1 Tax=Loktanella sp. DJP18 TaxID=3409788 RepID=UPI003BB6B1DA